MGDRLARALAADGKVRGLAVVSTDMVQEACSRHGTLPTASAALGRTMSAAALLGATLKGNDRLNVQILGDGPLRHIVAAADASGNVRGYVGNPLVHLPLNEEGKLDVARAVGKGTLYVIRDLGLKEPYRGSVPLVSGEIGEDLAYYFARSEQTPSVVALGVLVDKDHSVLASGGYLVQLLPGADEELISTLEQRVLMIPPISQMVNNGDGPIEILHRLLGDMDLQILEEKDVRFSCGCSRERFERALISLGATELKDLIEEQGEAELTCHFCNEREYFDREDLERLLDEARRKEEKD